MNHNNFDSTVVLIESIVSFLIADTVNAIGTGESPAAGGGRTTSYLQPVADIMTLLYSTPAQEMREYDALYKVHLHDSAGARGGASAAPSNSGNKQMQVRSNANFFGDQSGGGGPAPVAASGLTLSYWCFSSSVAMAALRRTFYRSMLLTSGTLAPLDAFERALGVPFAQKLSNAHVVSRDQVFAGVLETGPAGARLVSSFETRDNEEVRSDLGRAIAGAVRLIPDGVLVFFPSYPAMEAALVAWAREPGAPPPAPPSRTLYNAGRGGGASGGGSNSGGVAWRLEQALRRGLASGDGSVLATAVHADSILAGIQRYKPVVVEPRQSAQFAATMQRYKESVESRRGAVFFGVCRGKASEGFDFADTAARGVIVTGMPYASAMDPRVQLKRYTLNQQCAAAASSPPAQRGAAQRGSAMGLGLMSGKEWYDLSAARAVNQAVGRVIRHRRDFGAVLFCDARFAGADWRARLPAWLAPSVRVFRQFGELGAALGAFMAHAQATYAPDDAAAAAAAAAVAAGEDALAAREAFVAAAVAASAAADGQGQVQRRRKARFNWGDGGDDAGGAGGAGGAAGGIEIDAEEEADYAAWGALGGAAAAAAGARGLRAEDARALLSEAGAELQESADAAEAQTRARAQAEAEAGRKKTARSVNIFAAKNNNSNSSGSSSADGVSTAGLNRAQSQPQAQPQGPGPSKLAALLGGSRNSNPTVNLNSHSSSAVSAVSAASASSSTAASARASSEKKGTLESFFSSASSSSSNKSSSNSNSSNGTSSTRFTTHTGRNDAPPVPELSLDETRAALSVLVSSVRSLCPLRAVEAFMLAFRDARNAAAAPTGSSSGSAGEVAIVYNRMVDALMTLPEFFPRDKSAATCGSVGAGGRESSEGVTIGGFGPAYSDRKARDASASSSARAFDLLQPLRCRSQLLLRLLAVLPAGHHQTFRAAVRRAFAARAQAEADAEADVEADVEARAGASGGLGQGTLGRGLGPVLELEETARRDLAEVRRRDAEAAAAEAADAAVKAKVKAEADAQTETKTPGSGGVKTEAADGIAAKVKIEAKSEAKRVQQQESKQEQQN